MAGVILWKLFGQVYSKKRILKYLLHSHFNHGYGPDHGDKTKQNSQYGNILLTFGFVQIR